MLLLGGQNRHPRKDQMATANNTLETLLNEHDVARIMGLSVAPVRRWRLLRQGSEVPQNRRGGSSVRGANAGTLTRPAAPLVRQHGFWRVASRAHPAQYRPSAPA